MPYADPEQARRHYRERARRRRAEFFADKVCARCGGTDELQLHHRDPSQKVANQIWHWSRERREAEIAKCDVLCATCHREHHSIEQMRPHGESGRYDRGCRCPLCRAANTERMRDYRRRQRETAVVY